MRITFAMGPYFPVPPLFGSGVEVFQLALAEEIASRGHQVTMISRQFGDFPADEVSGGVHHLRVKSRDAPRSRLWFRLYDLIYSRRVARVLPPSDITLTNSLFLPCVLPRQRAGRLYVHVARFPKNQLWLYRHVDRLQAVSTTVGEAIRRQVPSMSDRVSVIPPAVTGVLARPLPAERIGAPRAKTILYVGRIAREKGIHALIQAFVSLAKEALLGYRLEVVGPHEIRQGGDGPDYLRELKALAAPAGDKISFEGFIPDIRDLRQVFERADIFVYPSLAEYGESFGLAPLQAMAAGCRVILSNLACFREFLQSGFNGVAFEHEQQCVANLAASLTAMIKERDAAPMRQAAVSTVARFQLAAVADRFIEDFVAVLDNRRVP
jgi:glycosyltransferase involved in cell wall biosynthesis